MAGVQVSFAGNLTQDPDYALGASGTERVRMRVAVENGYRDRQTQEWKSGETTFLTVIAWGTLAGNVAASLGRGRRVLVRGTLQERTYETPTGEQRKVYEVTASDVAADLRWVGAKLFRVENLPAGTRAPEASAEEDRVVDLTDEGLAGAEGDAHEAEELASAPF